MGSMADTFNILLTGATGYVGGEVLHQIYKPSTGSSRRISVLIREESKKSLILNAFPDVRVVLGDLDNATLIKEEAANADVVLHLASTSHAVSAQAIADGLSSAGGKKPKYWIQVSGASMFSGPDIQEETYGEFRDVAYDDLTDIDSIRSIIASSPKRVVDQLVLSQDPAKVSTALVVAPLVYGTGEGQVNTRSIQAPEMARLFLAQSEGFRVGPGKSVWSNIHVCDLGKMFSAVLDAAEAKRTGIWNDEGIYLPANGKMTFGQLAQLLADEAFAKELIQSKEITRTISADEANAAMPGGAVLWATNAITMSSRAQRALGWTPVGASLIDVVPNIIRSEAARAGRNVR